MAMVTTNVAGDAVTLRVVGPLKGSAVRELERQWHKAQGNSSSVQMDLCGAYDIDGEGKALIAEMFASGVELLISARPLPIQ
jgi:ABC-type transporter Mla MlaB component